MEKLDFLAVGDITTDTFIRLKDAQVSCDSNHEGCTISMRWGDKIPYESATEISGVGNAANAAVSAARLELSTGLLTSTGSDQHGDENVAVLTRESIDTSLVSRSIDIASNHDFVLWYGNERTILIKHSLFPYRIPSATTPPPFVYLSSLGDPTGVMHHELVRWLAAFPETKLLFQPGLEIAMGRELLAPVYAASHLCVCNKEEAEYILGHKMPQEITALLKEMSALGPKIVIITDGMNGAYAYDGSKMWQVPLYPDLREPLDRTGAGDAFASTIAAALALGEPFERALLWGPINSMSVVQEIGAQRGLLSREKIQEWLAKAPTSYVLTAL